MGLGPRSPSGPTRKPLPKVSNPASRHSVFPPLMPLAVRASGPESDPPNESWPAVASSSSSMELPEEMCGMTSKARHVIMVYGILFILLGSAFVQLLTLRYLDFDIGKVVNKAVASTTWMLMALVCFLILACVNMTNTCPINYLLALVIVEAVVFFTACDRWSKISFNWGVGIISVVVVINIVLHILGILLPLKLQPGAVSVLTISILYSIIVGTIFIIVYLNGNIYMLRYFSMVSLAFACLIVQFTVTVVYQRRKDFLTRNDYVLQATILAFLCVYMCHASIVMVRFGKFLVDQV
ncbi:hypothetical protein KR067_013483 [Drosophila pandora]|nr:hypothetical protein KR067_013483 [Drosophila pandora]